VVTKHERPGVTTSQIARLETRDRIAELARMLSGAKITGSTTKAAKELLAEAKKLRRA
jgi:DNA repair protein RecN (Recombination protein N)